MASGTYKHSTIAIFSSTSQGGGHGALSNTMGLGVDRVVLYSMIKTIPSLNIVFYSWSSE